MTTITVPAHGFLTLKDWDLVDLRIDATAAAPGAVVIEGCRFVDEPTIGLDLESYGGILHLCRRSDSAEIIMHSCVVRSDA